MDELGIDNTAESDSGASSKSFANIPAPTAEVKVRTMRSDLASLTATGGGLPRFNKVNVEGLSIARAAAPVAEAKPQKRSNLILVIAIVVVACVALAVGGLLLYNTFSNQGSTAGQGAASNNAQPVSPPTSSPVQAYVPPAAATTSAPVVFTHVSFFKKPADQTITLSLSSGGAAQTASELQTYDQQVLGVLASTTAGAQLIEIDVKGGDGNALSIEELLSQADAEIIDPNFLSSHFNPDATFFAYRDKNGFWPGYVIALNTGENKTSLQSGVQAIESSAKIGNIFLAGAGTASPSGFGDAMISGVQVRILNFTGVAPANGGQTVSASFVYGWFRNYLIISASREGFAQAVARL